MRKGCSGSLESQVPTHTQFMDRLISVSEERYQTANSPHHSPLTSPCYGSMGRQAAFSFRRELDSVLWASREAAHFPDRKKGSAAHKYLP